MSTEPQNLSSLSESLHVLGRDPATYVLIKHPIRHHLYICRERSTNHPFLCKTNPILIRAKINLTLYIKKIYGNFTRLRTMKNKPNTNPIRTQNKANFLAAQMNVSCVYTKYYENKSNWTLGENKPNTNPIKANVENQGWRGVEIFQGFASPIFAEEVVFCLPDGIGLVGTVSDILLQLVVSRPGAG